MNLDKLIYKKENNKMRISKTKVITILVFITFFVWPLYDFLFDPKYAYTGVGRGVMAAIIIGLIFAIPTYIVGFLISRILEKRNNAPQNTSFNTHSQFSDINTKIEPIKTDKHNNDNNPSLLKINELKKEFDESELATKELIKAKFEPPQITYDRFIAVVDNCSKIFNEQYTSAINIINFSNDSQRIDEELNSKINILQSLIDKLSDLSSELAINISKTKDDNIDDVLNDMENLISSIHNYEE